MQEKNSEKQSIELGRMLVINVGRRSARSGILRKLGYNAACMEKDDVEAEFWRGVVMGLRSVRTDWGDAVAYLIQRGVWQVKSTIRAEITRRILQSCNECNHVNGTYSYDRRCEECGANVENTYRAVELTDVFQDEYTSSIARMHVESLRTVLSPHRHRVFDAVYEACVFGEEHPVSAAARKLGISKQRISLVLSKIRKELPSPD